MTAMYQIAGGKSPPIAEDIPISSYAREFVSLCCAVEPNDRPSVEELLQHIFILQGEDDRESMCCQFLDKSKDERMIGSSPLSVPPLTSPPFTDGDIAQKEESINTDLDQLPPASRHLSEGQMLLQKLNRVVVIDINASSAQDSVPSASSIHDQVTPIINQTRKRRVGSNSSTLQAVNISRGSPLLPPTGKKTDKKNNPPKPTSPTLTPSLSYTEVTSPLSVIGPIPSSDDTVSTSRSRSNSSACPTPVMFSNNSEYHRRASRGGVETPSDSLMSEEKMMSSTYGSRSVSQLDLFEAPIPLSRSASLNDALVRRHATHTHP
jgi:serine/threonine protein kinase